MIFWDSSAVVPLLVREPSSAALATLLDDDPAMLTAWTTAIECASAIARLERADDLRPGDADRAYARLDALTAAWLEVQPTDVVRRNARRVLRVHDLRAADALQLASAIVAAEGHPASLPLVTLDDRLGAAARLEGFRLAMASAG